MHVTSAAAWVVAMYVCTLVVAVAILRRPMGPLDHSSGRWLDVHTSEHVVWGMVSYLLLLLTPWSVGTRFLVAAAISSAWELAENTTWAIKLMRAKTASVDYRGDTVVNISTDLLAVLAGFGIAHLLPWYYAAMGAVGIQIFNGRHTREDAVSTAIGLFS